MKTTMSHWRQHKEDYWCLGVAWQEWFSLLYPLAIWMVQKGRMTQLETQGNNDSWKKSIEESWKELHYISRVHFFLSSSFIFSHIFAITHTSFFFLRVLLFIFTYLFLAVLGFCYCVWTFSSCREQGAPFHCCVRASSVAEHRFECGLSSCGAWA